ncbi:MAG: hypothetical protein AVDCRST_MAG86-215 [uncultured Truepera sp.]|uniref:Uncharacterized protein n=1 Tax=uncultured Truepera sp. TaxID=543023 RepID=A0A6J4UTM4_9DEIN|nr:MAG: hypothetical protein AVDCRST_MAG86-215 [uncultured Truepera sp.]
MGVAPTSAKLFGPYSLNRRLPELNEPKLDWSELASTFAVGYGHSLQRLGSRPL